MRPVYVADRSDMAHLLALQGTSCDWQFAFELSGELPEPVERAACLLLSELLPLVIAYRHDLFAVAAVTRKHAEQLCDEIEETGILTIHGVVVWAYGMLSEYLGLDIRAQDQ
jgi:hypothetical protein